MLRSRWAALALTAMIAFAACDEDDGDDSNEYRATLTGANERPTAVNTTAQGNFTLVDNGANMTYTLTITSAITGPITGAHIHAIPRSGVAPADTTGGIVVDLQPSNVTTGLMAQGTITQATVVGISMDSLRTLINAGRTYVNVHTQANPAGHIRGTIVRD